MYTVNAERRHIVEAVTMPVYRGFELRDRTLTMPIGVGQRATRTIQTCRVCIRSFAGSTSTSTSTINLPVFTARDGYHVLFRDLAFELNARLTCSTGHMRAATFTLGPDHPCKERLVLG